MKMKYAIIVFVSLLSKNLPAGDAGGHGGGNLARLLSYAKEEISRTLPLLPPQVLDFNSSKLDSWYAKSFENMSKEVKTIQLMAFSEKLTDSYFGYETWIRLKTGPEFIVEYNPNQEKYQMLVGNIQFNYRGDKTNSDTTPDITTVTEFLLHEIGHRYGLDEDEAWKFAQVLVKNFIFTLPLQPKNCRLTICEPRMLTMKSTRTFKIDSSEMEKEFLIGDFKYHIYLIKRSFSFYVQVYRKSKDKYLSAYSLILPANSQSVSSEVRLKEDEKMILSCE